MLQSDGPHFSLPILAQTERLRALVENARGLNLILDAAARIEYCSPSCLPLLGWQQAEMIGESCFDFVPDHDHPQLQATLSQLLSKPVSSAIFNIALCHHDGSERILDCSWANMLDDPAVNGIVCNCRDYTELARRGEELSQARGTLKAVLDSTKEAISAVDTQHRLLAHNEFLANVFRQMFGAEIRDGMDLGEIVPPEENAFWKRVEDRALQGEHVTEERTYVTPFGENIVEFTLYPIYDGEKIVGASSFGRDVTLQRRAEWENKMLFDNGPVPKWIIDLETLKFLRVNRAVCKLYGYTEEEFLTMTPLDIRTPEDAAVFRREGIHTLLLRQDQQPVLVRHQRKDGSLIQVQIISHVTQYNGRKVRLAMVEDITKRLKAETELLEANERFRMATESVASVIYEWDVRSGECHFTPALLPLLGFDPEREVGINAEQWWNSRIHPDDLDESTVTARGAFDTGTAYDMEYRIQHKSGHYVYVWDRGSFLRDAEGNVLRVIGSAQDITARKRMEAQLVQERNSALTAKESAEEMSRLKTNFLANMSHEIRTPMTAILGFAEILAERLAGTEEARQAEIIERSATRLLSTINGILDLARIESRKIELTPCTADVNAEIERLVTLLEPLASQKGLDLRFIESSQPSNVHIDTRYLEQVLTNIIGNAIKFTHEGYVHVEVHLEAEARESASPMPGFVTFGTGAHPKSEHFRIVVSDSGVGISQENISLIFDEFKQESTGYQRSFEGTGLGLTISSRLVTAMGGSIEVQSARGVGSTFIVRLPCMTPEMEQEQGTLFATPPTDGVLEELERQIKPIILLVEDTPDNAAMVRAMLSDRFELHHAPDADQALHILNLIAPDLILMDTNLGEGMSGLQLAAHIRRSSSIPIIAVTAYAMPNDRNSAIAAGCDGYLAKPFTKMELHRIIQQQLQPTNSLR